MIALDTWLWFCATEAVLSLTPGPAVLCVLSVALGQGAGPGLRASLGILAANAGYFVLSATSLGALLLASWNLFVLVKWLGAAYLVWLGLHALFAQAPAFDAREPQPAPSSRSFWSGLLTQGANPKALVFFAALLPQFVDASRPVAAQIAVLGLSSLAIELAVLGGYVAAAGRARRWSARPGFVQLFQRASGALLLGAAAGLATIRRET